MRRRRRGSVGLVEKRRWKRWVAVGVVLAAFWLYGAVHVIYGEGLGVTTCWKVGWSFSETFVDIERIQFARDTQTLSPKLASALDKCQVVPDASAWQRDRIIMVILAMALLVWLLARGQDFTKRHIKGPVGKDDGE